MLDRAVGNPLENADKWSPPGTPIRLVLDGGTVTVHDRGPGIAPEERGKVFDRFYRGPDSGPTRGSGIGLSLVRHIAQAHGGRAWARNAAGGGAVVGFWIPAAPA